MKSKIIDWLFAITMISTTHDILDNFQNPPIKIKYWKSLYGRLENCQVRHGI